MSDCIVIGGGIIGLLTARELNQAGAKVTLLERGQTGRESSWAGGGIISPLYPWRYANAVTELARWSQALYPEVGAGLLAETGIDPEYIRSGMLILDTEEKDQALAWAATSGSTLQVVEPDAISNLEPALAPSPTAALWMPDVGQVRNPRLAKSLRSAIDGQVDLREGTEVVHLLVRRGRVTGVETSHGELSAEHTVVCAGAWTRNLLADLSSAPAIEPVRGQMILFQTRPETVRRIVLCQDHYAIPRRDGHVLVGSTLEHSGFDKHTTKTARAELEKFATRLLPQLADYPIENHWAGLRPGSPSGIPYIGKHPRLDGLFVNSGHFRNGVVLAPASCRLLADILLERTPILDPAPYALTADRTV